MSDVLPSLLTMLLCIVLSAYFSATETAFSCLNKTRLKALAEGGSRKAALALRLSDQYDKLISTILIGNNIVNIALASIGTLLLVALYGDIGATLSTVGVTIVVLVFGEITPKSMAKDYPERFAMFSGTYIRLFIVLLAPLNFVFAQWKKLVVKVFRTSENAKMSQDELLLLLDEVEQEGAIDASEGELLRNAVEFKDLSAQDMLTHRVDLEAVSVHATPEEIGEKFTATRYSRLLVYEDSIDKIVGVLHIKDFYRNTGVADTPVRQMMTPPLFVPQTEKADDLLRNLKASKSHIAVVIDEYGGTQGIVTMEDLLEELVGEIWDEHDDVVEPIRQTDECTFVIDANITFEDFCDHFDIRAQADSVSLGGWVMEHMDCIPHEGSTFDFQHVTLAVTKTDGLRVEEVTVKTHPVPAAPAPADPEHPAQAAIG